MAGNRIVMNKPFPIHLAYQISILCIMN